jgi:site-specific DNA recombinase
MGRVLGATRLSHDTDASTSIERQREAIQGWSRAQGHQVVAITEDTDVSGSIAPQDRDGLGPWLSNGKVGQFMAAPACRDSARIRHVPGTGPA